MVATRTTHNVLSFINNNKKMESLFLLIGGLRSAFADRDSLMPKRINCLVVVLKVSRAKKEALFITKLKLNKKEIVIAFNV